MINLKDVGKQQAEFLKDAYTHKKIAHSYLFVDPMQKKGLATAYWLACLFNCNGENKPDGTCNECHRILTCNNHDVFLVDSNGKQSLSIDQVRPLKQELSKSPVEGTRRFFFIKNAEKLTLAANNALLNLLEEPVAPVVTILITTNENQILPTVRSRTQIISFENEKVDSQTGQLLEYGLTSDEIEELGNLDSLKQEVKYLYQELFEHNELAFVRAYHLAQNATSGKQKFVFYWLKNLSLEALRQNKSIQENTHLLDILMQIDKMYSSNVSFINCLDYLILNF